MALACAATQKMLYFLLTNDTELIRLLGAGKVFDYVPDGTRAPFVVVGDDSDTEIYSTDFSDLRVEAHEQQVTLHTWTEAPRGRVTVKTILSRFHDLLIEEAVRIDGFEVLELSFQTAQVLREDDGLTYHGMFRVRLVTQPLVG